MYFSHTGQLEQLEMEKGNRYSELNYTLLNRWEERNDPNATKQDLARILNSAGRGDLSDMLADWKAGKYIVESDFLFSQINVILLKWGSCVPNKFTAWNKFICQKNQYA